MWTSAYCCHVCYNTKRLFVDKKSSRYQADGPTNVQPSDADPSSQSGSEVNEDLRQRMEVLSVEDPAGYVPQLPAVSNEAHEKADMLIAYCTVKGMIILKTYSSVFQLGFHGT